MLDNLIVTVKHMSGTRREVADRARTTIGLGEGDKPISDSYMRKLYLCEHSPIRIEQYLVRFENIPYWVAMHLVRHQIGVTPFVSTQRTDRTGKSERGSQEELVTLELHLNAQSIINISRKRLCSCASPETRNAWERALIKLDEINPVLVRCCVPDCVYRGWCMEHKSCKWHKKRGFRQVLNNYRDNINDYGGNEDETI